MNFRMCNPMEGESAAPAASIPSSAGWEPERAPKRSSESARSLKPAARSTRERSIRSEVSRAASSGTGLATGSPRPARNALAWGEAAAL